MGRDAARPVSRGYQAPFAYPDGTIDRVVMRFFGDVDAAIMAAVAEAAE